MAFVVKIYFSHRKKVFLLSTFILIKHLTIQLFNFNRRQFITGNKDQINAPIKSADVKAN